MFSKRVSEVHGGIPVRLKLRTGLLFIHGLKPPEAYHIESSWYKMNTKEILEVKSCWGESNAGNIDGPALPVERAHAYNLSTFGG